MKEPLLEVHDLNVTFSMYERGMKQTKLQVISGLDMDVRPGEIVAVAGSSGSGKSLLAHAVLGLLPQNAEVGGEILFNGKQADAKTMAGLRGTQIALVPQSVSYLDPLMRVEDQVLGTRAKGRRDRMNACFERLELKPRTGKLYPFQLSGGMARRVLFSTAVLEDASLIIADEPTPGMHWRAAAEAMQIFRELADAGKGILLITHDIDLAIGVADRVAVFYAGTVLEIAAAADFSGDGRRLRHPYTRALWRALPQNGFHAIPGTQPYAGNLPKGCVFGPRCAKCKEACGGMIPMRTVREGSVRCIYAT